MVGSIVLCTLLVWRNLSRIYPMNRPEGLLLAVQQHIHFAHLLADNMKIDVQVVLDGLSKSGMRLVTDENDVGLDAAKIFPRLKQSKLEVVK